MDLHENFITSSSKPRFGRMPKAGAESLNSMLGDVVSQWMLGMILWNNFSPCHWKGYLQKNNSWVKGGFLGQDLEFFKFMFWVGTFPHFSEFFVWTIHFNDESHCNFLKKIGQVHLIIPRALNHWDLTCIKIYQYWWFGKCISFQTWLFWVSIRWVPGGCYGGTPFKKTPKVCLLSGSRIWDLIRFSCHAII